MLTLQEKIKNLETISQQELSPENRQILIKEIKRLKQELTQQQEKAKHEIPATT